jgi:hypothetical protein
MMKAMITLSILMVVSAGSGPVLAHDMTLDRNGCHRDGKYGKYHCHEGEYAGKSFVSANDYPGSANFSSKLAQDAPVKLNSSGYCITPDSVLYNRQKSYRLYPTVKQCLREGGHLDGTIVLGQ